MQDKSRNQRDFRHSGLSKGDFLRVLGFLARGSPGQWEFLLTLPKPLPSASIHSLEARGLVRMVGATFRLAPAGQQKLSPARVNGIAGEFPDEELTFLQFLAALPSRKEIVDLQIAGLIAVEDGQFVLTRVGIVAQQQAREAREYVQKHLPEYREFFTGSGE